MCFPRPGKKEFTQASLKPFGRGPVTLGVPIADLLPTTTLALDDLAVTRQQAKRLFDILLRSDDRAVLILMTQLLARFAEATNR
jgi:hypothetical protein